MEVLNDISYKYLKDNCYYLRHDFYHIDNNKNNPSVTKRYLIIKLCYNFLLGVVMRFFIILFLLIILFIQGLLFVAFTATGNDMLLPYINSYLRDNIPAAKVEVLKLRLKPSSVGILAKVNDSIDIKAKGKFDILSQDFNVNYIVDTHEIKTPTITIKEHINIKGNAQGSPEAIKINGKGLAFESNIVYALSLIENVPQDIKVHIEKANIQNLLVVAGQKPYAKGLLTLHAIMPKLDPDNPQGDAKLIISHGILNSKLIKDDFNISIAKNTKYSAGFRASAKEENIAITGKILSDLANLTLNNGIYNLKNSNLSSDYIVDISDLKKLKSITEADLKGKFKVAGKVMVKDTIPEVTGTSESFGGKTTFAYKGDTLNAKLSKIETATLLHKLGQPNYIGGNTNANIKLSSIKNLNGTFNAQVVGAVNTKIVKKEFDTDLGKKFYINSGVKGDIKEQKVFTHLILKTTMANIKATNAIYDIKKQSFSSNYLIDIPDMGKLQPISGKQFKGDMQINGNIKKDKNLIVSGHGKEFGGSIDFKLLNDDFKADVQGATVSKVMHMLDYPQVLEALSKAKVNYNIATGKGDMVATLDNAQILPNQLTKLLKEYGDIDLTSQKYNNSKFLAKITKNLINFSLDARNKNNYFVIKKGALDKITGAINATVDMKIQGKDLKATVRGTVDNPKVSLDASEYLKNMAKDKILKSEAGKKAKKLIKKKLKSKTGKQLKDLAGGMF